MTKIPDKLYHFTRPSNVISITSKGLVPSRDRLGNRPLVWLNTEPQEVRGQALLAISTTRLDKGKFRRAGKGIVYSGSIPSKCISIVGQY